MSLTYAAGNAMLAYNFGRSAYTVPATLYFGLATNSSGTLTIADTTATEPTTGSYARVAYTNSTGVSVWTAPAPATIGGVLSSATSNVSAVTFPESTASWGTITYVCLFDASTSGTLWWFDQLTASKLVQTGTIVQFVAGAIVVYMGNT